MTAAELSAYDRTEFVKALGWIFEGSPWVAERAWERRPFGSLDEVHAAMARVVAEATEAEQLALLRAHPDLGTRARISHASTGEQRGAELDRLTPEEFARLQRLNTEYRNRFGFPFLFAVRGRTRHDVLTALAARVTRARDEEFAEALHQVYKIARFRLESVVAERPRFRDPSWSLARGASMERLASGPKDHYYGKADVMVYRLIRDGRVPPGRSPVFGADVKMLTWGGAFWPTYLRGDNTGLIATDSMKNFIHRETFSFTEFGLENYCRFIGRKFLDAYSQVEGLQMTALQLPYTGLDGGVAFIPAGPDQAFARIEMTRDGVVDAVSGIRGFKLLRLRGSAFQGFVRDQHTTLPDRPSRVLHMWLDVEWSYENLDAAFSDGTITAHVRAIVMDVFQSFESGSIQQIIHQMGTKIFAEIPEISELRFEANNRTWDVIQERGEELGVYVEPAAPFGVLGLTLTR